MAENFKHQVPGDLLENKEKFLRYFSTTSIIAIIVAIAPGLLVFMSFNAFGNAFLKGVGVVLWILIEAFAYFVTSQKKDITAHRYDGGGRYPYQVWLERYKLKKRRALYIKGYDKLNGEEDK